MGLGNIAGVAVAVAVGGPGATFWMIVCGLLGMSTKFVECTLGVKYRDLDSKGNCFRWTYVLPEQRIERKRHGRIWKSTCNIICHPMYWRFFWRRKCFSIQPGCCTNCKHDWNDGRVFGIYCGLLLAILTGIVIIGGIKRIAQVTEKIVPFMAGLYIIASLIIIFGHFSLIDDAIALIFKEAFTPSAGLGGVMGVLIMGFRRAVFSNEAGAGSAAIAHSAVRTRYPASEGIVSLLEPFIDTVVICTMTALVIVIYNMNGTHFTYGTPGNLGGVDLTSAAYNDVIPHFSYVLTVAIVLFAFSTMISWSYYGLQAWKYLFGRSKTSDLTYKILFLIFIIIGASATLDAVVRFSDAMILAMVFPNMVGLLFLFPRVKEELNRYLQAIRTNKNNS